MSVPHQDSFHEEKIGFAYSAIREAVAKDDYKARRPGELDLSKDEPLQVLLESNRDWWTARTVSRGKQGLVHRDNLSMTSDVYERRYWYCSGVSEKEAEAMLMKPANVKGSFLVRDGDDSYGYYLDVRDDRYGSPHCTHYPILLDEDQNMWYIVDKVVFFTIKDLVQHYTETKGKLCCRLVWPCQQDECFIHDASELEEEDETRLLLLAQRNQTMEYLEQLISSKQNVHDVQSEQPQLKSLPPLKQPTIERSQQVSSLQTSSNLYDEMTSVKTTASTSSSETGDSAYMDVTESPENIYVEARVKPITYIEYAAKYQEPTIYMTDSERLSVLNESSVNAGLDYSIDAGLDYSIDDIDDVIGSSSDDEVSTTDPVVVLESSPIVAAEARSAPDDYTEVVTLKTTSRDVPSSIEDYIIQSESDGDDYIEVSHVDVMEASQSDSEISDSSQSSVTEATQNVIEASYENDVPETTEVIVIEEATQKDVLEAIPHGVLHKDDPVLAAVSFLHRDDTVLETIPLEADIVTESKIADDAIEAVSFEDQHDQSDVQEINKIGPLQDIIIDCSECMICHVMYNYAAKDKDELSLRAGEVLHLLNTEGQWWYAHRPGSSEMGYIPSNYVAAQEDLDSNIWYFGAIPVLEAQEKLFSEENQHGAFLVRETTPGNYTLSVRIQTNRENKVRHYKIMTDESGRYYISTGEPFDSISELVSSYQEVYVSEVPLNKPCSREPIRPSTDMRFRDSLKLGMKIGTGMYSDVYEGTWRGMRVSVKQLKLSLDTDMFLEQAVTLRRLRHDNLVPLYGLCLASTLHVIMQYLPYGSLQSYLQTHTSEALGVQRLLYFTTQIVSGMEYLEGLDITHGSLAASNVMVGKSNVCKVSDYGMRAIIEASSVSSEQIQDAKELSVEWQAPEVIEDNLYSTPADVWSFGVLMIEMFVSGEPPFAGITSDIVRRRVREGYRLPQPAICPDQVYSIMTSCWRHSPHARPSFHALTQLLQDYCLQAFPDHGDLI